MGTSGRWLLSHTALLGWLAALSTAWAADGPAVAPSPYAGLSMGLTPEGALYVGDPNAAMTMEEWTDYACPFCAQHFNDTLPRLLNDYVRPGKVRLIVRDFPIEGLHPNAPRAHAAARCVAQQDASKGWAMHDALFARQQEWTQKPDPAPTLEALATASGANIATYLACIGDMKSRNAVAASVSAGRALGFSGTPSFRITRTTVASAASSSSEALQLSGALPADDFGEILDALIAGREPPLDPGLQGKAPLWARAEGLALDPARPGFTKAGDPVRGNAAAKVYVVEFVDYASAASRRHHEQVQPALDSKWVDTGKVAWITKNLPMRVHREAPMAAVAARCAAEQGELREMQDLLFAERARWAAMSGEGVDPSAVFMELASRARLAMPAFQACYAGRAAMASVLRDVQDAQGVADRAPTFVVLGPKSGGAVTGPLSLDDFDKLLETTVTAASATDGKR